MAPAAADRIYEAVRGGEGDVAEVLCSVRSRHEWDTLVQDYESATGHPLALPYEEVARMRSSRRADAENPHEQKRRKHIQRLMTQNPPWVPTACGKTSLVTATPPQPTPGRTRQTPQPCEQRRARPHAEPCDGTALSAMLQHRDAVRAMLDAVPEPLCDARALRGALCASAASRSATPPSPAARGSSPGGVVARSVRLAKKRTTMHVRSREAERRRRIELALVEEQEKRWHSDSSYAKARRRVAMFSRAEGSPLTPPPGSHSHHHHQQQQQLLLQLQQKQQKFAESFLAYNALRDLPPRAASAGASAAQPCYANGSLASTPQQSHAATTPPAAAAAARRKARDFCVFPKRGAREGACRMRFDDTAGCRRIRDALAAAALVGAPPPQRGDEAHATPASGGAAPLPAQRRRRASTAASQRQAQEAPFADHSGRAGLLGLGSGRYGNDTYLRLQARHAREPPCPGATFAPDCRRPTTLRSVARREACARASIASKRRRDIDDLRRSHSTLLCLLDWAAAGGGEQLEEGQHQQQQQHQQHPGMSGAAAGDLLSPNSCPARSRYLSGVCRGGSMFRASCDDASDSGSASGPAEQQGAEGEEVEVVVGCVPPPAACSTTGVAAEEPLPGNAGEPAGGGGGGGAPALHHGLDAEGPLQEGEGGCGEGAEEQQRSAGLAQPDSGGIADCPVVVQAPEALVEDV